MWTIFMHEISQSDNLKLIEDQVLFIKSSVVVCFKLNYKVHCGE